MAAAAQRGVMYDAIVAGVGGMGSAALHHLAARGARVLGLERFTIPHDFGSSHGLSRIIRLAYAEDPRYVPLLRRSYELWRELERETGEELLRISGGVDAGTRDSETVTGSLCSCEEHDLPHELLDAQALHRRFPGYRLPEELVAVYQPDAGILVPERCILAHLRRGAEVHTNERVLAWEANGDGVTVTTERATYRAKTLILTAGAWMRELVPLLRDLAVPERQVLLWTNPLRPELFTLGRFPIFNLESAHGRFYGFPSHGEEGFKIGKYHHRNERVDAETVDRAIHPEDEEVLREGIRHYFPDADGPAVMRKTCLFSNSPDEHFVIDVHPEHRRVVLAAGFSGHGFKFCSVVGEILAGLALDGGTEHDIGMFELGRFGVR